MDDAPFDDADALPDDASDAELAATVRALIRADLGGDDPGAVMRSFTAAGPSARVRLAYAWNDAMDLDGLASWIASDDDVRRAAEALACRLTPPDPVPGESDAALAAFVAYGSFADHPFPCLVVPGYTPTDAEPSPEIHPVARRRLEVAVAALRAGDAPFVIVSGGNVHPRGTPYHEGTQMKQALLGMGVPADRILVDPRGRSSMTNLRNAGRLLLRLGQRRALVITLGGGLFGSDVFGQDFYFAHPDLSTFHLRCERELGYRVGDLSKDGESRIAYTISPDVTRVAFRDALDP